MSDIDGLAEAFRLADLRFQYLGMCNANTDPVNKARLDIAYERAISDRAKAWNALRNAVEQSENV